MVFFLWIVHWITHPNSKEAGFQRNFFCQMGIQNFCRNTVPLISSSSFALSSRCSYKKKHEQKKCWLFNQLEPRHQSSIFEVHHFITCICFIFFVFFWLFLSFFLVTFSYISKVLLPWIWSVKGRRCSFACISSCIAIEKVKLNLIFSLFWSHLWRDGLHKYCVFWWIALAQHVTCRNASGWYRGIVC